MSSQQKRPQAIIFDWDNTLVDTWGVIHDALNATFREFDVPLWTLEETKARVAKSMRDSFPDIFGDAWQDASKSFYTHFEAIHLDRLTPMADAAQVLEELSALGIYLGVVSNKTGGLLRAEAQKLGWEHHFGKIIGAMDAARDKPAKDPVLMALQDTSFALGEDIWFVGDSRIDMECAYNTGCTSVLVRDIPPSELDFAGVQPKLYFNALQMLSNCAKNL